MMMKESATTAATTTSNSSSSTTNKPIMSNPLDVSQSGQSSAKYKSIADKVEEELGNELVHLKQFGYRLVILGAIGLGLATYFLTFDYEREEFFRAFADYANEVAVVSAVNVDDVFRATDHLSVVTTSTAVHKDISWPNITIPHFETVGKDTRFLAKSPILVFSPAVTATTRQGWEAYAVENQQLLFQGDNYIPAPFPPEIHNSTGPLPASAPGPFSPVWQISPTPANTSIIKFDLLSSATYQRLEQFVTSTKQAAVSQVVNTEGLFYSPSQNSTPQSVLLQPVMTGFKDDSQIGGHYFTVLTWEVLFQRILSESAKGVIVVLSDFCGQGYTFEINGPSVVYLGEGDLHDPAYDGMVVTSVLVDDSKTVDTCQFISFVYPSRTLQDEFMTNRPGVNTAIVVLVVLCTGFAFAVYDWHTKRQEQMLIYKAERTHALVTSLFPANVHERIITDAVKQEEKKKKKKQQQNGMLGYQSFDKGEQLDFCSKPIADLFPHTTVLFCDIIGFTAWSSVREPSQIFTLLESIFCEFDELAKQRGIFKVETVGDCYVAVAGLPEPREDHAVAMCKFARDARTSVQELLPKLEVTLGPDTSDLAMRFGLHSGPVTAGVLRGEKARFQLFGDTMNTAARIETSSAPDKIHLSKDTAALLMVAGKESWIQKREDVIVAKGKGAMETYWLVSQSDHNGSQKATSTVDTVSSLVSRSNPSTTRMSKMRREMSRRWTPAQSKSIAMRRGSTSKVVEEDSLLARAKTARLVEWNTEVLLRLLKQIVARRNFLLARDHNRAADADESVIGANNRMVIDEVKEIIVLPEENFEAALKNADSIVLDEAVVHQLRDFVSTIARAYNDNPFHNFEHASHVTMSVTKLLSRIVAPSEREYDVNGGSGKSLDHAYAYGITSDPLTQFSCILSALIHDADHPGVPNAQLLKEETMLSQHYKGKSIAEQNSVDIAWRLLMQEQFADLRKTIYTTATGLQRFRQLVVNSVMATDIVDTELKTLRNGRWAKAFSENGDLDVSPRDAINRKATIVIEHLIQASDVAHTMQHWHIYRKWNEKFFIECYKAFKEGRAEKNPVDGWYQGELGFFDFYIIPLAKKLHDCGVFGVSSDECLNYAVRNRKEWETKGQEIVAEMFEKVTAEEQQRCPPRRAASHDGLTPFMRNGFLPPLRTSSRDKIPPRQTNSGEGMMPPQRTPSGEGSVPLRRIDSGDGSISPRRSFSGDGTMSPRWTNSSDEMKPPRRTNSRDLVPLSLPQNWQQPQPLRPRHRRETLTNSHHDED